MCSSFYEIPFDILIEDVLSSNNSTISVARARSLSLARQDFGQIIVPVFLRVVLFEHPFRWQRLWQPKFYKENDVFTQKLKQ